MHKAAHSALKMIERSARVASTPEAHIDAGNRQMTLTALVTVPTLLTVFTIIASLEIAGRLRGGRGLFGWLGALPWDRPMVLATGMSFVMLFFGGGGLVNMSYSMNALIHNTSWVTAHFHLIFGGTAVIMYFAIAYAIWPRLAGRESPPVALQRLQLWLWFIGMLVMTLPWHWLGLQGQWRRSAQFDYTNPIVAPWGHGSSFRLREESYSWQVLFSLFGTLQASMGAAGSPPSRLCVTL
jgi:heme/copper-type cytochrome/quinol oxidase subunit 1